MTGNLPSEQSGQTGPRIRHGRVESIDLYEIKDSELDLLEKGSPASIQLNFSIFLLSIAFTSVGCLATATFTNQTVKTVFVFIGVIGIIMGAYLLILWARTRSSIRGVVKTIRNRIPIEPCPQPPGTLPKSSETGEGDNEPVG